MIQSLISLKLFAAAEKNKVENYWKRNNQVFQVYRVKTRKIGFYNKNESLRDIILVVSSSLHILNHMANIFATWIFSYSLSDKVVIE